MPIRAAEFPDDRGAIDALLAAAERRDGYPALTEDGEIEYHGGPDRPGLVVTDGGRVTGYAQLRDTGGIVTIEMVLDPRHRAGREPRLLLAALQAAGKGPVALWASGGGLVAAAAALGFREQRAIVQLTRSLPSPDRPEWPEGVTPEPFVRGRDEPELLALNRAAFAGHPDNASWDAEVLEERMARPWFDGGGLIAARRGGRMIGACWTKPHRGGVGEIYWVAVHPDEQGGSIGRALVLAGMWHLGARCDTVTVYAEVDNVPARRLYERLGFRLLRVKRRLVR